MFVPRYTEEEAREAVRSSLTYSEALRKLGLRPVGGNHRLFRDHIDQIWQIPTDHFDPVAARLAGFRRQRRVPLEEVLVEASSYKRAKLKERLYEEGFRERRCELCGQDEWWHGTRISLILDHINGVPDDNRLINLRIVCPNCAATLDTHCGRKNRLPQSSRGCALCGTAFMPRYASHRYCSRSCGERHNNRNRAPKPETRKVPRPSYEQLKADVAAMSFVAIGRKYGVSDNAVRKWLKWYGYQEQQEAEQRRIEACPDAEAA
jgi:hypothetical protein